MTGAPDIKRFTVVTGHYGCGKTNLSINLALDAAPRFDGATLVDLDIVNPYFRSSDYTQLLESRGVRVIAPTFAGTTLDVPSLSPAIGGVFDSPGLVIFDVGGDDAGATALGRYAADIAKLDYDLLYVVNAYRALTTTADEATAILREIERTSKLTATGVVNNSHLRDQTTLETVADSMGFARETAEALGLPLRFTTYPARLRDALESGPSAASRIENKYPVQTYVRTPWEGSPGADEEVIR